MSRMILATPGQRKANKVWQECLNYANALSRHRCLSLQEIWQVYYQRVRIGLRSCSDLRPHELSKLHELLLFDVAQISSPPSLPAPVVESSGHSISDRWAMIQDRSESIDPLCFDYLRYLWGSGGRSEMNALPFECRLEFVLTNMEKTLSQIESGKIALKDVQRYGAEHDNKLKTLYRYARQRELTNFQK